MVQYWHLVIAFVGALLFVLVHVVLKRPWQHRSQGIENLMNRSQRQESPLDEQYLVPLLVLEERYPIFGEILDLVLGRFPLTRFLDDPDFERPLRSLGEGVFQEADPEGQIDSMCQVVHRLLRDPEVEYRCRPHLEGLVRRFLDEVQQPGPEDG